MNYRHALAWSLFPAVLIPGAASAQLPGGGRAVSANEQVSEFQMRMQIELAAVLRDWEASWTAADAKGVHAHYAADLMLVPPRGVAVRGAGAHAALDTLRAAARSTTALIADLEVGDFVAFVYGPSTFAPTAPDSEPYNGVFAGIMTKDGLNWQFRAKLLRPTAAAIGPAIAGPSLPTYTIPDTASTRIRDAYSRAAAVLNTFRSSWNDGNAQGAKTSLAKRGLVHVPGQMTRLRGDDMGRLIADQARNLGKLTTVAVDFGVRDRMSWMTGRYLLQSASGTSSGNYIAVFVVENGDTKLRAIVFT